MRSLSICATHRWGKLPPCGAQRRETLQGMAARAGFAQGIAQMHYRLDLPGHGGSGATTAVGLIGGGRVPLPREFSLSHNGGLFLDEHPEFKRHVLGVLHQPFEKSITEK